MRIRISMSLTLLFSAVAATGCGRSREAPGNAAAAAALTGPAAACWSAATGAGETGLCASCECGSCTAPTRACFSSGDSAGDAACRALVACAHRAGCQGDQCYCGAGAEAALCPIAPKGPCVAEVEAATGKRGLVHLWAARTSSQDNVVKRAEAVVTCGAAQCAVPCAGSRVSCDMGALACQDRVCTLDASLAARRLASSATPSQPVIEAVAVAGRVVWRRGDATRPRLAPGQEVILTGRGFGAGTDVDLSKLLVGNARVLEEDLKMYDQKLDLLSQVNYEVSTLHSRWPKDVLRWSDGEIAFRVPVHASSGPILVQVQKRLPGNGSLLRPGELHAMVDAQDARVKDPAFAFTCDEVSGAASALASDAVPVDVENPSFPDLVRRGREVFWSYDYNIGLAHALRNLDWTRIVEGRATDPVTGLPADPQVLFGANRTTPGEVPPEAFHDVHFDPYPMPNPIPGFLLMAPQLTAGWTRDTGWAGYRYAQASSPFQGTGEWIGFNCAGCHGYRLSYEQAPGKKVTKVVPGLPNPRWSMKWAALGDFKGVKGAENGPRWAPGTANVDKTALIYSMPQGAGEHAMIRMNGEGASTDNDYEFSPIAIPAVTRYLPVRRSLSHTESYVGFEGSYIHSEEPDGSLGSMSAEALQALTAYMSTLDESDGDLRRVGLYRWLVFEKRLAADVGAKVTEGQFVQAGPDAFPALRARIERGRAVYAQRCGTCHSDAAGLNSNESMIRLDEVGRFFAPTIYQKAAQSIRTTFLRDLYFTSHRGLLTDGHVRNLRDLVDPARCTPGTPLYEAYYTLHAPRDPGPAGLDFPAAYPATGRRGDVFRVPRAPSSAPDDAGAQRNRFIERHRYFVTVPWDPDHYYWDYQRFRAEYGPAEMGTAQPVGMPAAPHPWCAASASETDDLLYYLHTL
jgi:mono/diheme cytochrome c family protein